MATGHRKSVPHSIQYLLIPGLMPCIDLSMNKQRCPNCDTPAKKVLEYREGWIAICGSCRLQWSARNQDIPEKETDLPNTYSHYLNPANLNLKAYKPFLDFFSFASRRWPDRKLRILDVGCGNGSFMRAAMVEGHDVRGIEANEALAAYMPSEILERVSFMRAQDFSFEGGHFDIITFWDSFEHIPDAFAILSDIEPNLNNDGIVYLRVNNRWDIYNIVTDILQLVLPGYGKAATRECFNFPYHAWNFSFSAMCGLLSKGNWEIIEFAATDTPVERLTSNKLFGLIIKVAYLSNKIISGGKIGDYYIAKRPS
jgi:SAM-dependent methyltransferase